MASFFNRYENFKYTVRGFFIGVIFTAIILGIFISGGVKAEETEIPAPVVVSDPISEKPVIDGNELEMLAHLIGGEAGSEWCEDKMLYYVGSVVLNRVKSPDFPNTLEGVIFQKGQYACTWDGNYNREPSERCYRIAEQLLTYGSVLPDDVVYQAQFIQGSEVYAKVQNMYFCHK